MPVLPQAAEQQLYRCYFDGHDALEYLSTMRSICMDIEVEDASIMLVRSGRPPLDSDAVYRNFVQFWFHDIVPSNYDFDAHTVNIAWPWQ